MRKLRTSLQKQESIIAWLFILPTLIGLGIFVFGALIYSLYISFTRWDMLTPARWVGLGNYLYIFRDPYFVQCMYNTLYFVVLIVPLGIVIALAMAMLLNQKVKGLSFFRAVYYTPSITSK
jgi:multiple sugar transport system permease protein